MEPYFCATGNKDLKLSDKIKQRLKQNSKIKIITGFLTRSGFDQIAGRTLEKNDNFLKKLEYLVVGRMTLESYNTFEYILKDLESHIKKIFMNRGLGYRKDNSIKYAPMIHSKIIAIDYDKPNNFFYIGSANITKTALIGENAEAGVIYENLDENHRNYLNNYMDELKKKCIEYDTKKAQNLMYLSAKYSAWEELKFLREFMPLHKMSLILCYNPEKTVFSKGDSFYTQVTEDTKKNHNVIHGLVHHKTKRYIFFYLFDDIEDLLEMNLKKAIPYCTESTGLIQNQSVLKIDALITYYDRFPPIIILKKIDLVIEKTTEKSFQALCTIPLEKIKQKYEFLMKPAENIEKIKQLIITERLIPKVTMDYVPLGPVKKEGEYEFRELAKFEVEREYHIFNDVLSNREKISINKNYLAKLRIELKKFIDRILQIENQGDINNFLKELNGLNAYFEVKKTMAEYINGEKNIPEYTEFIKLIAKNKNLMETKNFLFLINKKLMIKNN